MKKLRGVKFSMRRWSGQRSKDDGSIQMSVRAVPEILSRSVSLNSLDKDRDASNLKISPNIPPTQASQESVLEKNLIRPPSLRLDLSRASSYGGSMNTLANSPTIRKEGFLFYRELTLTENDSLVIMLSAVYAKLLVVMGISFPLAEVISHKIPASYYEGFYLYLYMGSISFLIYVYLFLLRTDNPKSNSLFKQVLKRVGSVANSIGTLDTPSHKRRYNDAAAHCGSFYLRLGALAFGIGSMIYSGLEFGQFFEIDVNSHCYNILYALTPSSRMAFTFIQLYFIFLNSRMAISKYKTLARFGLMHMIATNLCVWLHVLVQETKHEMLTPNATHLIPAFMKQSESHHSEQDYISPLVDDLTMLSNFSEQDYISPLVDDLTMLSNFSEQDYISPLVDDLTMLSNFSEQDYISPLVDDLTMLSNFSEQDYLSPLVDELTDHHRHRRWVDIHGIYISHGCRRLNIMGELVQDASPFLFPCTIEYSLICAAILYVMWKNIGQVSNINTLDLNNALLPLTRHRHHYQVDCAKANKGLFTGIIVLVLSIICLIIFFVLINKPQYKYLAILEAHIAELALYLLTTLAVVIALVQVRELKYNHHQIMELDSILLIVAQSGLYLFTIFSVIGGHFTMDQNTILVLLTALVCLIQGTFQTIFILDASRRFAGNKDQAYRKPGREMVTFLLVCNFAMWAINTLETRRADSNPVQMEFYGFWAWTIITHVTSPLTIFFRFHSTVCLCDIWKRTYKLKAEFV